METKKVFDGRSLKVLRFSILDEKIECYPCLNPCTKNVEKKKGKKFRCHFHCPTCGRIITRAYNFQAHFKLCYVKHQCYGFESIISEQPEPTEVPPITESPVKRLKMLDIFEVTAEHLEVLEGFVDLFKANPYVLHSDKLKFFYKWLKTDARNALSEISSEPDEPTDDDTLFEPEAEDLEEVTLQSHQPVGSSGIVKQEPDGVSKVNSKRKFLKCQICNRLHKSESAAIRHYQIFHSDKRVEHKCPRCGKVYYDKKSLYKHNKRKNGCYISNITFKDIACKVCKEKFTNQELLDMHLEEKHKGADLFSWKNDDATSETNLVENSCDNCGKIFLSNTLLQKHYLLNECNAVYSCPLCTKVIKNKRSMLSHYAECQHNYQNSSP
nr:zinc finger and BTB domain-containing protein 41 [Ciona intestinalis]|eukprot:XP_026696426.1 zinc finger and BTB domain-containing protein 41 [Ciona intestinalis]